CFSLSNSRSKPNLIRRNVMHSNSMMKAVLAVVLCVSLATTGCTADWIKVALADLPLLTQMALNIASLVAALETGKQVSPTAPANTPVPHVKDLKMQWNAQVCAATGNAVFDAALTGCRIK